MPDRIAVLSDVHIGTGAPTCWFQDKAHTPSLVALLDWVAARRDDVAELVLLGDVIDTWTYPFDVRPPTFGAIAAANPDVFGPTGALARVLDALNGAVTYLPGNHDLGVTAPDVATVRSPGGHQLRFAADPYLPSTAAGRVMLSHGHRFTLFNAPDPTTKWAPLPVGHFVTRTVATHYARTLAPGQTVADLPDQGAPDGFDWSGIVASSLRSADVSIAASLIRGVAGKLGVSTGESIILADGTTTTLEEVIQQYAWLFTNWQEANGSGFDGLLVAAKAALADYDAGFMGWFAQREAFRTGAQLVVMGHTHTPISGLERSLVDYINTGFECPSVPDMARKPTTFALIDSQGRAELLQVVDSAGGQKTITPHSGAAKASIVLDENIPVISSAVESVLHMQVKLSADFSCYIRIDNATDDELTLAGSTIGHGHFVALPETIPAHNQRVLWLQDYPDLSGSDAVVTYRSPQGGVHTFSFDCPTGVYSNSVSGGTQFRSRAGNGPWLPPGQVSANEHPLFVEFTVKPGSADGVFVGQAGQNSSATSTAGLHVGQSVIINGSADLSRVIVANDQGKVHGIRLAKVSGIWQYGLYVDAEGPEGPFSGSMYLRFTDQTGDQYRLSVFRHQRDTHLLSYNSAAPTILKIEWSNYAF